MHVKMVQDEDGKPHSQTLLWRGKNYIDGKFLRHKEEFFENFNPSTEESLGEFPFSTPQNVADSVSAARKAFKKWRHVSRVKRGDYFYKLCKIVERRREELAIVVSLETGKSYNESIAEINEALHMAMYAFGSGRLPHGEVLSSEIDSKDSYILRKPKGVIAIICPFNFPVAIGSFWCAAPSIVEGNTVVLKPSEDAPMSSQICAEMYHEAGFPNGVFNLIHGEGGAGKFLVQQDVDHVCFTGSVWAGRDVRKECSRSWHKTSSCEMGSKSACIVFDDANFDLALEACVASAYKLSGQRCVSSGRMIVQRGIYDKFVERFVEASKNVVIGAPIASGMFDEKAIINDITYGPIINQRGYDKVVHFNDLAEQSPDTEMLLKGEKIGDKGWFLSPTVYKTPWVPNSAGSAYLRDEVFGPHVSLIPFDDVDDAIRIYNDTEYGLALGILTEDFHKARYCRDRCDFGMGYWNGGSIAAESHLSFGGVKKSGNGYPSAARTFRAVTHEISWTVNHGEEMVFPQGMDK